MIVKNNWYVVTGAPSSGKTTTLKYLEKKGYKVYYEWARIYIDQEIKKGKTIDQIRKNEVLFQKKILELKVDFEKKLSPDDQIFMERGIPDTTAYMKWAKGMDSSIKKIVKKSKYKKVYLMDILRFKKDYARTENEVEAFLLDKLIEKSYRDLGIEIVRVPNMTVAKRAKFILDNL